MLLGTELARAIQEMGLNPNSFAKKCVKADGKPLSQSAILNLINNPKVRPEKETADAVESALKKRCRCCRQYTEREDAWDHSAADAASGGKQRKG